MAVDAKTVADAAVRLAAVMAGVPQGAERKSKAYRDALAAITNTAENRMSLKQGPPVDKLSRKALVSRSIGDSRKNSSRFKGPAEFYLATRDIAPDIVWTMIHEAESAVAALQRDKMGFIPEREMTQVKLEPRVVVGRNVGEGIDKGKGKAGQEPLNIKQESESPAFSANDEGKRGGNPADQLSAVSVSSSSTRLTAVDADFLRKLMTTYPFNIHKSKAPLWLRSTPTYKSIQAAVKGKTAEAAVKDRLPELVATMVEEVCRMPRWTQSMNELSRKCSCGGTASASCDNGKCGRCCRPPCKNHLRPK
ncbi:hypothetical protein DFJ73DRAFT_859152 [Zopfochytrium polystomum]|nr:hypothetical protein DFJ73DRAFT_859152 [Zopfochytrium polystomum]